MNELSCDVKIERIIGGNTDFEKIKTEFAMKRKNKLMDKKMHSVFERNTVEIRDKRATWTWTIQKLFEEGNRRIINGSSESGVADNSIKVNVDKVNILTLRWRGRRDYQLYCIRMHNYGSECV